jgi:hypothetical protein
MSDSKNSSNWSEDLKKRYLRGESSMFILHGNVFDAVLHGDKMLGLTEFLTEVFFKESRDSIVVYNVSSGARFPKKTETFADWQSIAVETDKAKVLTMLERSIRLTAKTAVFSNTPKCSRRRAILRFRWTPIVRRSSRFIAGRFCPRSNAATTSLF